MPKLLGIDLVAEAAKLASSKDVSAEPDLSEITRRTYRMTKEKYLGQKVQDLQLAASGGAAVAALRRAGQSVPINRDTCIGLGDELLIIGRVGYVLQNFMAFGEETPDSKGLQIPVCTAQVVVSNPEVIGIPVNEIQLEEYIGVLVLGVRRHRTEPPVTESLELLRGDVITVYGPEFATQLMTDHIGLVELDVVETDLFTFGLGVAVGIGLGSLAVTLGGVTIKLGMAGGLLISGLTVGFLRSIWPVFGRVPSASRWLLMDLGLLMFMAGVGINSGGSIVEVIRTSGIQLIGVGMLVTSIPVFAGYFVGRKILKLNPAEVLGGVTGSMTSGAALSVVTDAAQSDAPSLGYTGAYAFANVILTLAGTLIMLL